MLLAVFQVGERLGKTATEIMAMDAEEFMHWVAYFKMAEKKR